MNRIITGRFNILGGALEGEISFQPGLNIISGENGTLKTKMLQALRQGSGIPENQNVPLRIHAISPKRNAERRQAESILQLFRQQNRTLQIAISERLNGIVNDTAFENYSSLGDLYYLMFEDLSKDGGDRKEHMDRLTSEFNEVISSIFHGYRLKSDWDPSFGAPRIRITKAGTVEIPIEGLSLGEQEILSLASNIFASLSAVDVYLIDEPEVHLNWHLEEKLFDFFYDICNKKSKQMIIVTHSRTIFRPRFMELSQFLSWNDEGRIVWSKDLSDNRMKELAGEAIDVIRLGDFTKLMFFVEDNSHEAILREISDIFEVSIGVTVCGNSSNVKSLYRQSKKNGNWKNSYFLIDGDNQGNPYPGDPAFIHLPVYCIENYLLNIDIAAKVTGKTKANVKNIILDIIKKQKDKIFKNDRFFEFMIDGLSARDINNERLSKLDASLLIDDFCREVDISKSEYVNRSIGCIMRHKDREILFSSEIIHAFSSFEINHPG